MENKTTPRYIVRETPPDYVGDIMRYGTWDTQEEKFVQFNDSNLYRSIRFAVAAKNCDQLNAANKPRYRIQTIENTQLLFRGETPIVYFGVWDTQEHEFIPFAHGGCIIKGSQKSDLISEYVQFFNSNKS